MLNFSIKGREKVVGQQRFRHCQLLGTTGEYELDRFPLFSRGKGSVYEFLFGSQLGNLVIGSYSKFRMLTSPSSFNLWFSGSHIIRTFGNSRNLLTKMVGTSDWAVTSSQTRQELVLFGVLGYDFDRYSTKTIRTQPSCDGIRIPVLNLLSNKRLQTNSSKSDEYSTSWGLTPPSYRKAKRSVRSASKVAFTYRTEMSVIIAVRSSISESSGPKGAAFLGSVRRVAGEIRSGGIMQLQVSRRLFCAVQPFSKDELVLVASSLNPTPFPFEFSFCYYRAAGTSPETLIRIENVDGLLLTIKPIAGTRPRNAVRKRDAELKRELVNSTKEVAEHIMLVDLARNDLSKVVGSGKNRVNNILAAEQYSHVQHLVSTVRSKASSGLDIGRAVSSGFPAGTVLGTPKQKARALVQECEKVGRSFYGGAVGSVSRSGANLAIIIRSFLVVGRSLYTQSAAGVVQNSEPTEELRETNNKVMAVICSLCTIGAGNLNY